MNKRKKTGKERLQTAKIITERDREKKERERERERERDRDGEETGRKTPHTFHNICFSCVPFNTLGRANHKFRNGGEPIRTRDVKHHLVKSFLAISEQFK